MASPQCPYCKQGLDKNPTRKKKCPHCGQFIFVRRGNLFTDQGVKDYDETLMAFSFLGPLGIKEEQFEATRQELRLQFKQNPSANDVAWRILNSLIMSPTYDHVRVYRIMAGIAGLENRDPSPYIKEAMKIRAPDWNGTLHATFNPELDELGHEPAVRVFNCNDEYVCPECRKVEGKHNKDEAALLLDLPLRCTSESGCPCWLYQDYSPLVHDG